MECFHPFLDQHSCSARVKILIVPFSKVQMLDQLRVKKAQQAGIDYLLHTRVGGQGKPDGFPCKAGQDQVSTESTAWCSIALRHNRALSSELLKAILSQQNSDGGWSSAPGAGRSDWTSGPALLALRVLKREQDNSGKTLDDGIKKALDYLFDNRTDFYGSVARLLLFMIKGPHGVQYARGWPWSSGCFHWVEPTSYNLMALKVTGPIGGGLANEIIERANQFLLEHACKAGGWNHGNDTSLGASLPPYTVTTAEALLALQDQKGAAQTRAAIDFVKTVQTKSYSAMERAWTTLALNAYKCPSPKLLTEIVDSQHPDGSFGPSMMTTALSLLALETVDGTNVLSY